jgi:hypothetical protein
MDDRRRPSPDTARTDLLERLAYDAVMRELVAEVSTGKG